MFAVPILSGFWLERGHRSSIKSLFLAGAAPGLVLGLSVTYRAFLEADFNRTAIGIFAGWLSYSGLMTLTGGLAYKWFRRLRTQETRTDFASWLARQLVISSSAGREPSDKKIQRIASLIAAIAPILTFVTSIVGAYFTYLAAMATHTAVK
jgi:hypothetical protein